MKRKISMYLGMILSVVGALGMAGSIELGSTFKFVCSAVMFVVGAAIMRIVFNDEFIEQRNYRSDRNDASYPAFLRK